jgi:hypothetical protein
MKERRSAQGTGAVVQKNRSSVAPTAKAKTGKRHFPSQEALDLMLKKTLFVPVEERL